MPLEVFLQVSSYLTTPDLGSLRLTCKHAEASLFETFAREFFSKKQFMLSETSLQALIDISNHERLSQFLSHVIIGLDSFESASIRRGFNQTADAGTNRYNAGLVDEHTLLNAGLDREMLAQAFRNLPNLHTVGLRDYSSRGRVRDDGQWHSYGSTTIFQETGVRLLQFRLPYVRDEDTQFASRAFASILYALGQSGAKPQVFEILLRKTGLGLPYDAFKISNFFKPSVTPLLSSLDTLLLTMGPKSPENDTGANDDPDVEYPDFPLREYFCHTPNLTHLRINFQSALHSNPHRFMVWLGRPVLQTASINPSPAPQLSKSPDPIALSRLQRLDIGMLTISPRVLLTIIHKFKPTLRSLSLWKIDLKPEDHHQQGRKRTSAWPRVFARVSDLDYLSVGCIGQVFRTQHQRMGFKRPAGQTGEPNLTRTCSVQSDMENFINNLVADAVVTYPEGDNLSDYDDDDDDESMSDYNSDTDSDIDIDDDE
ncbi:hypothetical protein V491_06743 [Pseudogymnoascus sp. VKM F-3775]|nr:hypothetical protein V491_06743 [Pseudogymnoascus sp. VKM F-3775]